MPILFIVRVCPICVSGWSVFALPVTARVAANQIISNEKEIRQGSVVVPLAEQFHMSDNVGTPTSQHRLMNIGCCTMTYCGAHRNQHYLNDTGLTIVLYMGKKWTIWFYCYRNDIYTYVGACIALLLTNDGSNLSVCCHMSNIRNGEDVRNPHQSNNLWWNLIQMILNKNKKSFFQSTKSNL